MSDSDRLPPQPPRPTATRPLLGMTLLAVEDSRYACDALRLMALRSGARIRRADCLQAARRHLSLYRPTIAVVDLGLPDGSGAELIKDLAEQSPRLPVLLGTSGDPFAEPLVEAAGADGFLDKPLHSLLHFQNAIIAALPPGRRPGGIRLVPDDPIRPDPLAYQDDIAHAASLLDGMPAPQLADYLAQFLGGLARSAGDAALESAAAHLAEARSEERPVESALAHLAQVLRERLDRRMAI
ncbi:response regulator [Salipiger sp. CCB-MM3]|uniref:response regulator n=1 Tax=Salipiger sp. CCB-MM3 TaxID=1792508 RepID=UPI00080A9EB2|nr:response regulator [Salipiger sp. CCB-MM3]ANT60101.1 response regulator [Salipiger sp. CCB-MM3]